MRDDRSTDAPPDIVRRAVTDGLWNTAALAVPGIANVLIVAYLFRSLGPADFAPWATVVAVLGLLTILDAGLSATTARNAARALAGDIDGLRLVRAAYSAYAVLAVAVLVLGLLASPITPLLLGSTGDAARSAVVVGIVLAMDLGLVIGSAGWLGTLRGARRFELIFAANVVQVVVALPATLLLVPWFGLPGAATAQFGGRLAGRLVATLALRRAVPTIALQPGALTSSDARALGLFALPVFAIAVSTQLGVGIDPVIVALAAGPAAVGLFAAGSGLVRYAAFLLFPVIAVLLPSFAELGYSRPTEVAVLVIRCVRLAAAIGVVAFGSLAVSARPVLELWIGSANGLSVGVLVLYAVAHAAWAPSQVLIVALIAVGRHGSVGLALLADSLVNVAVSVVLVLTVGPIGVAFSTLVALWAVHLGIIPLIVARRVPVPVPSLVRALVIGVASGLAAVALVGLVPADGLGGLLARAAIAIGAIAIILAIDQRTSGRRVRATPQP